MALELSSHLGIQEFSLFFNQVTMRVWEELIIVIQLCFFLNSLLHVSLAKEVFVPFLELVFCPLLSCFSLLLLSIHAVFHVHDLLVLQLLDLLLFLFLELHFVFHLLLKEFLAH